MKLSLWLIALQWLTAFSITSTSFILFVVNKLALHHYQNALGGKLLPAITQWTDSSSVWWYLYPIPILLIAIYGSFAPATKKDTLVFATLAAIAFSVAIIMTIIFGTVLPAIPYWPFPMTNE